MELYVINKRSSHASGVILFDEDPYEFGCFMKTPKGEIITQWDLHMDEACGLTKYDFLVTEVQDKIAETIKLLQKYNKIDSDIIYRINYGKAHKQKNESYPIRKELSKRELRAIKIK